MFTALRSTKSTKSLLDPTAFRVNPPGDVAQSPPRRLPVSRSRQQLRSPAKTDDSFATAKTSTSGDETAVAPKASPAKGSSGAILLERRLTQRGKSSVANLRDSFEQPRPRNPDQQPSWRNTPPTAVPRTPVKQSTREKSPVSSQSPRRRNKDMSSSSSSAAHPRDGYLGTLDGQPNAGAASPSNAVASPPRTEHRDGLKCNPSDHFSPAPPSPVPTRHSPSALPFSARLRQRQAIVNKSRTYEHLKAAADEIAALATGVADLTLAMPGAGTTGAEKGAGEEARNGMPHSSPIHPLFRSGMKEGDTHAQADKSHGNETSEHSVTLALDSAQVSPTRLSRDAGVLPRPVVVETYSLARPETKSDPTTRRPTKVSDLRRMFDRPSLRRDSPTSFISFARNQRRTGSQVENQHVQVAVTVADPTLNKSSSQRANRARQSAPELKTEITTNDFSCDFLQRAEASSSMATTTKPESPLKDRIRQFEGLSRPGSPGTPRGPGRAKSHDGALRGKSLLTETGPSQGGENTNEQAEMGQSQIGGNTSEQAETGQSQTGEDTSGLAKTTEAETGAQHAIRERGAAVWRRISSTLSQSIDGLRDFSNASDETSRLAAKGGKDEAATRNRHGWIRRPSMFGLNLSRWSVSAHSPSPSPPPASGYTAKYPKRQASRRSRASTSSGVSIDVNETLTATLDVSPPFLRYSRTPSTYKKRRPAGAVGGAPEAPRPTATVPMLPARKSVQFLSRLSRRSGGGGGDSGGTTSSSGGSLGSRDVFLLDVGLDGVAESTLGRSETVRARKKAAAAADKHSNGIFGDIDTTTVLDLTSKTKVAAEGKGKLGKGKGKLAEEKGKAVEGKGKAGAAGHTPFPHVDKDAAGKPSGATLDPSSASIAAHSPVPAPASPGIPNPNLKHRWNREYRRASREERHKIRALWKASKAEHDKAVTEQRERAKQQARDRKWGDMTPSGFAVHATGIAETEIQQPKPKRPGQVKRVVEYYKELSQSRFFHGPNGGGNGGNGHGHSRHGSGSGSGHGNGHDQPPQSGTGSYKDRNPHRFTRYFSGGVERRASLSAPLLLRRGGIKGKGKEKEQGQGQGTERLDSKGKDGEKEQQDSKGKGKGPAEEPKPRASGDR